MSVSSGSDSVTIASVSSRSNSVSSGSDGDSDDDFIDSDEEVEIDPISEELETNSAECRRRIDRLYSIRGLHSIQNYHPFGREFIKDYDAGPAISIAERIYLGPGHCRACIHARVNGQYVVIVCARPSLYSQPPFRCQDLACNRPEVIIADVGSYVRMQTSSVFESSSRSSEFDRVFHGIHPTMPIGELSERMAANWTFLQPYYEDEINRRVHRNILLLCEQRGHVYPQGDSSEDDDSSVSTI